MPSNMTKLIQTRLNVRRCNNVAVSFTVDNLKHSKERKPPPLIQQYSCNYPYPILIDSLFEKTYATKQKKRKSHVFWILEKR